jgi:hypothetical protein
MPDQANGTQGQGPGADQQQGQGPAAQQGQQQGQQQQTGQGQGSGGQQQQGQGDSGEFDLSQITDPAIRAWAEQQNRRLHDLSQENARYRTAAKEAREQVQQFQRQNETDQQRQQREATEAQQRLESLERENRSLKVGQAVRQAATKANAFDPEVIATLVDAQVSLDDNGQPTNVAALVAALQADKPWLFRRTVAGADAGAGQGSTGNGPTGSINDLIRRGGRTTAPLG